MDETTLPAISDGPVVGLTTVLSLLSTLAILGAAWLLSRHCLPAKASLKVRSLFIWHAFDALVHIVLEGSYLWNCFLSFKLIDLTPGVSREASAYLPPGVHFLDRPDRLYGAEHGSSPFSALWREYSKADARWQGTDLTVISLELLTVFLGAPIAVCICWGLARSANSRSLERASTVKPGSEWFWMIVLATGELYGGESVTASAVCVCTLWVLKALMVLTHSLYESGVWNSSCSFISCLSLILLVIGPQNACMAAYCVTIVLQTLTIF